jgi:hypothetical protein
MGSDPDRGIPQGTKGSKKEGKNFEIYSRAVCSLLEGLMFLKMCFKVLLKV